MYSDDIDQKCVKALNYCFLPLLQSMNVLSFSLIHILNPSKFFFKRASRNIEHPQALLVP